jgi:DNA-binding NtrC family response regulator
MKKPQASLLLVDDDTETLDMMKFLFKHKQCCRTATSAEAAMKLLEAGQHFDVIITDLQMRGASGLALCEFVRQIAPDTKVVIVTGRLEAELEAEAKQRGAFAWLTKPLRFDQLFLIVNQALAVNQTVASGRKGEVQ